MNQPFRVALVSEHASPLATLGAEDAGGQNVYVHALAAALAQLGCEVDVFTRRDDSTSDDLVAFGPGVRVHHLIAGPPEHVPRDEMFGTMREFSDGLVRAWSAMPPDVVHAHFWMSGWASLRALRLLGPTRAPLVETFHALGSVKRRHQGAADTSPPERDATERLLLRGADAVVATCRDEVRELCALGAPAHRIAVVPCGVDARFTAYGPVDAVPRLQPHRIVCVSRLVPRKGIGNVVVALRDIPDTELVVAGGPAPEQLQADHEVRRLRSLAHEHGVADRVVLRGRLGRDDTAALMRSADLVACTPWYEPFGIVPVEAMASGVAVIGTAVGGLLDTVVDQVTGLHVPPRQPDAIAAAARQLLSDPVRRNAMGAAGAARARRLYRWPTVSGDILAVYRRLTTSGEEGLAEHHAEMA